MRSTTRLRELLARPGLTLAPFTYDAFTAKIAESVGFDLVYMSGMGVSMSRGFPDVGLLTATEVIQNAQWMARAVSVPLVADADTGYGNPLNVWRTVRDYEAAGVAGIHIEDQVFPKKCGFFQGKDVIPLEEHVQKVRAAVEARTDPDFVIIARCDALVVEGWEGTARRCRAYRDAGADLLFVDGIGTRDDLEAYAHELHDLPRMLNSDVASADEVDRLGFKLMIHRGTMFFIERAVRDVMTRLRNTGGLPDIAQESPRMRQEIAGLLGLDRVYDMEDRYRTVPASLRTGE
jgi:2-methylisocitrate lyase-like PEP mutase family enzyme